MGFVADLVLPQYSQAWSKAIDDRRDFNIAVNAKKNSNDTIISQAAVIYNDMEGQLKLFLKLQKKIQISIKNFMMNTKRCMGPLHL